jgi:beta-phosphoglucomutase-like phosphatase (HAD superfamily)
MKAIAVLAILVSSYYMAMTKVVMAQLQDLQTFYSHADQYAADIANGKPAPQTYNPPQSLQKLSQYSIFR